MAVGRHLNLDRRAFCLTSLGGLVATVVPLEPSAASAAADTFTILEARAGGLRLLPLAETAIWGYGGQVPGPLLRVRKGEEVKVRLVNKLAQPTSITWHGVRNINAMDGVAGLTQKPVMPGETFDYRFTPPDAGLFWYHPRVWPMGAEQKDRGLYGVLIVDEAEPPKADADLLVVLDDWSLDAKAQVRGEDLAQASAGGTRGALMTVNGTPAPATASFQPGARVRMRLLNACSARICVVSLSNAKPMVIAIDGQPSELFAPMRGTVPIGPGSRFEVIVDLPAEAGADASLVLLGDGEPDKPLLILKTVGGALAAHPAVTKLASNPLLPTRIHLERSLRKEIVIGGGKDETASAKGAVPAVARTKAFEMQPIGGADRNGAPPPALWSLNGVSSDGFSGKPLFSQKRGGAVTLTFVNKTSFLQQIHIHGHVWRLLHDLDDGWDPYWRDSVLLAPGKTKHVAFIADNPGKWAIGSSILDRQETGLAAWFEVS